MPPLRSRTVTHGRNMAGARALLRATGVAREDIGKPIMAVAASFLKGQGLGRACAPIIDGRFSGGASGQSICHVALEAAAARDITLIAHPHQ